MMEVWVRVTANDAAGLEHKKTQLTEMMRCSQGEALKKPPKHTQKHQETVRHLDHSLSVM